MNTVTLPWPPAKLNPNARIHWGQKSRIVSGYRGTCCGLVRMAGLKAPERGPVHVTVDYYPPDKRKRDWDNIIASSKALFDGLADALGVDDSRFVMHTCVHKETGGRVVVTISEVASA